MRSTLHAAGPAVPAPRRRWARAALATLMAGVAAGCAVLGALVATDAPPRSLGPYLAARLAGHSEPAAAVGRWLDRTLAELDRGDAIAPRLPPLRMAANAAAPSVAEEASLAVSNEDEVRRAIEQAQPGQVIVLRPGRYRIEGHPITSTQAGTAQAPITVRAEHPGSVSIEVESAQGFVVLAPHWHFENLDVRGVCSRPGECQHAFHVVGKANHFVLRNSRLVDFNAHIKINGERGRFPDDGLIEGNTISNTAARQTEDSVTSIDLVGASGWLIRSNVITDFVKAQGNRISFGAFAKGGGSNNRFERNVVVCEMRLRGAAGWRVGLSLGGGGTGPEYCRDGRCITEQEGSTIDSNLIASCSDDGIYLNRAAMSQVVHNTVMDTGGLSVRFAESSADLAGNLIDGTIRSRDGAAIHGSDNLSTGLAWLYLGQHPQRALFRDAGTLDLAWRASPPRRDADAVSTPTDLCGTPRPPRPAYGAFEQFIACVGSRR